MTQTEVAIVGHNNTKAQVSGKGALLVEVLGGTGTPGGPTTITPNPVLPTFLRTGAAGSNSDILKGFSVYNTGEANGVFLGEVLKPGEALNYDSGVDTFPVSTFTWDATGTEFIITTIKA
jgi:hypothetical protein